MNQSYIEKLQIYITLTTISVLKGEKSNFFNQDIY